MCLLSRVVTGTTTEPTAGTEDTMAVGVASRSFRGGKSDRAWTVLGSPPDTPEEPPREVAVAGIAVLDCSGDVDDARTIAVPDVVAKKVR